MIQTRLEFKLKAIPLVLVMLLSICSCETKETDPYKELVFTKGLPETLAPFEKDLPFQNFSYSNLETGSDTLQAMLGTFNQGSTVGYWMAIVTNGIPANFSTVTLEEIDTLNYRTKDIDMEFNGGRNRISVRVVEMDSSSRKIKYAWLVDSKLSKKAIVNNIEKPLQINSQFPEMSLESISGQEISSNQFKNQFIVINWWATWCAPCIKEIPGLNEIVDKYRNNENVRFIAITDDQKSRITDFLKKKDFQYEMTFANSEVRNLFGNSYPTNIIIDPTGKIIYMQTGAGSHTPSEIESSLKLQLEKFNRQELILGE
ncbi:TlpA disulfide reductase family protein [Salegentibacter sp. Hel_I_6]|uniref:TlpA family protein disulfide reductase n=1 Tax=Salegentibacter sp. Hel_I_6 TaxID=1250278 RepID=UPI000565BA90|nr:TlpA disulfide reductase family protein [Salegentibacter sp. Hel_I_6]